MGQAASASPICAGEIKSAPTTPNVRHFTGRSASHPSDDHYHREKKRKGGKLATLRRRLIRVRRHSKSQDYGKVMREFLSTWSVRELHALVEGYEAMMCEKELAQAASSARTHATTLREDLARLYEDKHCADLDLRYMGSVFPVHRAILCARCVYFRELLRAHDQPEVTVQLHTPGVEVEIFGDMLRFLYTGALRDNCSLAARPDLQLQLLQEFGAPRNLELDLRELLDGEQWTDAQLIFSGEERPPAATGEELGRALELRAHRAVLAARSPFLRGLLQRRARSNPAMIVLDPEVLPRQYSRVLLHALYQDSVDLSLIVHSSGSTCSLSEAQAIVSGKAHLSIWEEAQEIYQLGQFLDFNMLAQGCENIIVEHLSNENLLPIMNWASQPHGSDWVWRQCVQHLREEFLQFAQSPTLSELSQHYLLQAISSDFLQAGEADTLAAVVRWGEHQLMRKMEEREPNLLSQTAHSVAKKGIKKRDLNDGELREILADVLPYVRIEHILPPQGCDVMTSAVKRGLIPRPPRHLVDDDHVCGGGGSRINSWIQPKSNGSFMRPRLFLPYYEEAKAMFEEQLVHVQAGECVRLRTVHMSPIPDTLYMVDDRAYACAPIPHGGGGTIGDIIAGSIPAPDSQTLENMLRREAELRATQAFTRAAAQACADRRRLAQLVQLRVVREFGLPDNSIQVLQTSTDGCAPALRVRRRAAEFVQQTCYVESVSPHVHKRQAQQVPVTSEEHGLSPAMPDVALGGGTPPDIALASLGQLTLADAARHPQRFRTTGRCYVHDSPDVSSYRPRRAGGATLDSRYVCAPRTNVELLCAPNSSPHSHCTPPPPPRHPADHRPCAQHRPVCGVPQGASPHSSTGLCRGCSRSRAAQQPEYRAVDVLGLAPLDLAPLDIAPLELAPLDFVDVTQHRAVEPPDLGDSRSNTLRAGGSEGGATGGAGATMYI